MCFTDKVKKKESLIYLKLNFTSCRISGMALEPHGPSPHEILLYSWITKNRFMTFNSKLLCAWRWLLLAPNRSTPTSTYYVIIHLLFSPFGHFLNMSLPWPNCAEILIYVLIVSCPDCSSSSFIVFLNPCSLNFRGVLACYGETTNSCSWKECALYWSNVYWPSGLFVLLFYYTISLLTCYGDLVRKWMRQVFGNNSISDRFYWKLYPESFQLDFQWGKISMMVAFSLNLW